MYLEASYDLLFNLFFVVSTGMIRPTGILDPLNYVLFLELFLQLASMLPAAQSYKELAFQVSRMQLNKVMNIRKRSKLLGTMDLPSLVVL